MATLLGARVVHREPWVMAFDRFLTGAEVICRDIRRDIRRDVRRSIRRDRAQESHAAMRLLADTPYLLIPMTYKKARATTTAAQRQ